MQNCTYGRMVADTFCICEPYDYDTLTRQVRKVHEDLSSRHKDYLLEPTVGAYIIDDPDLSVEEMYIRPLWEAGNVNISLDPTLLL